MFHPGKVLHSVITVFFNFLQEFVLPEVALEYLNILVTAPGMIS